MTETDISTFALGCLSDCFGDEFAVHDHRETSRQPNTDLHFMSPAPLTLLDPLLAAGKITALQHALAQKVPMADDITVEADSGGHTDNRPLISLLHFITLLRDEMQEQYRYAKNIRVGAAGGIATPASALAAFMMVAAYMVTGSVNQACVESGTSDFVQCN